jgi:hypothetical protein
MKSADIQAEVSLLQKQRDTLTVQLSQLVQRFQTELPSVAEKWIWREVEDRIGGHPDTVAALGVEKLKLLKTKVRELIASLPKIAVEETSNSADWPHYGKYTDIGDGAGMSQFFHEAFRKVINHLGPVLDEFGLLQAPEGQGIAWVRLGDARYNYSINPGFDSTPVLSTYEHVYKDFRNVEEKLETKQKELARVKAKELWESA